MGFFDGCPGSKRIREPFPENIRCICGRDVEIWSDELETECVYCKRVVKKDDVPLSCLDWCNVAKECIGSDKFYRYQKYRHR